jgi:hypothetical protein
MKRLTWLTLVAPLVVACGGPSDSGQGVKTPDELVAEQERLAEEQEKESQAHRSSSGSDEETDLEKKAKFDKRQADLELKRAQRSAESCVGVVTEQGPTGTAKFSLTFSNDGHVKEGTVSAPFDGTPVGKCALNAMKAVIVPPFDGGDETVEWEIDLTPKEDPNKKEEPKKKK